MATHIIYTLSSLDAGIEMLGKVSSIAFITVFSILLATLLISHLHKARVIDAPIWFARVNHLIKGDSLLANFLSYLTNVEFVSELKTPRIADFSLPGDIRTEAPSDNEKGQRTQAAPATSRLPLTPRQKEFFDFLITFQREYGYSPTISRIQEHFGLKSSASVHQKLTELETAGLIRRHKKVRRGIEIMQWPKESEKSSFVLAKLESVELEIPLLGLIVAGGPIQSYFSLDMLSVPADMYSPNRFALKVRGESMRDDQISDGDFIIAEPPGNKPLHGKIVIALIDESETTVKRYYDERTRIRLQPANSEFEPILISPPDRVKIQGVVCGLIRKLR